MAKTVDVSEKDFEALFNGAWAAREAGDLETALRLDQLARKTNATLSYARAAKLAGPYRGKRRHWSEVPSVFESWDAVKGKREGS
jgi:hypothetical protein